MCLPDDEEQRARSSPTEQPLCCFQKQHSLCRLLLSTSLETFKLPSDRELLHYITLFFRIALVIKMITRNYSRCTFRIFFIFFCSGPGERRRRPRRWPGGPVLIQNRGRGVGFRGGGAGRGMAPGECLWGGGGGAKYFFSGPKRPPSIFVFGN